MSSFYALAIINNR